MTEGRYYTPQIMARYLASFCPRDATTLLEPSVGDGSLLGAVIREKSAGWTLIQCVDIDSKALRVVGKKFDARYGKRLIRTQADFLSWNTTRSFQFIAMNPPYLARKSM